MILRKHLWTTSEGTDWTSYRVYYVGKPVDKKGAGWIEHSVPMYKPRDQHARTLRELRRRARDYQEALK